MLTLYSTSYLHIAEYDGKHALARAHCECEYQIDIYNLQLSTQLYACKKCCYPKGELGPTFWDQKVI